MKDVAIDVIAAESRLPRFLARWVHDRLLQRLGGTPADERLSAE